MTITFLIVERGKIEQTGPFFDKWTAEPCRNLVLFLAVVSMLIVTPDTQNAASCLIYPNPLTKNNRGRALFC